MGVSVIIPILNMEKYLTGAIDSVFAQTYIDWELILVDDGSTDDSSSISLNYVKHYPDRVKYFRHEKCRGASAARNLGVSKAKYELIAFLDADDIWLPDKMTKQVAILESQPEVGMVYCPMLYFSDNDYENKIIQSLGRVKEGTYLPPTLTIEFLQDPMITPGPQATLIRREALLEIGGFEEKFKQVFTDQSLWVKVTLKWPVFVQTEPLVLYRKHELSSVARAVANGTIEGFELQFAIWTLSYLNNVSVRTRHLVKSAAIERLENAIMLYIKHHVEQDERALIVRFGQLLSIVTKCYTRVCVECGWRIGTKIIWRHCYLTARHIIKKMTSRIY